jgi:serine/threonine protein kinase
MVQREPQRTQYQVGDFISVPGTLYQVEEIMGSGGMGEAYRCFDRSLNVSVVLKLLQRSLVGSSIHRRFEFEARAIARIDSINVVRVTRLGAMDDGVPFYVMEYLVGPNLATALKKHPSGFRMDMALNVAIELLRGLEDIHERGIVHCDIKPDNVILHHDRGRMIVKIIDFGVMLVIDGARDREPWAGTPSYSAPEQIEERVITPRTDLFAVGLVLFEMLTGRRPYESFGAGENAARKRATVEAPKVTAYGEHYPPALVDAVAKALTVDPMHRFRNSRELILALEKIASALDRKDILDALTDPDLIDLGAQLDEATRPVTRAELENATDPDADIDDRMRVLRARAKLDAALGYVDTDPAMPMLGGAIDTRSGRPLRIVRTEPIAHPPGVAMARIPAVAMSPVSRPIAGDPTRSPASERVDEELSPSSNLRYADGLPARRIVPVAADRMTAAARSEHSGVARSRALPPGKNSNVRRRPPHNAPSIRKQMLVFVIVLAVFLAGAAATLYHYRGQVSAPPRATTGSRP